MNVARCLRTSAMKPEAENLGSTTSGAPIVRHSAVFHCGSM
ncbi:Uncharacterised protein [Mycobacteroides abscessus subsp. abscessus]|nr:Uncharacterised protein [Mycobacteroides abscessus subsp. abscessus]